MQYVEGCVAFIDILGFSKYVENAENRDQVHDLFTFVQKFQYLFNTSPALKVKVAFFSDSIVITTRDLDDLSMLLMAIWIVESYLQSHLGLLFRGGISKGKYYHDGAVAFGPAIIRAHELEGMAKESRILVDSPEIDVRDWEELFVLRDYDGKYYLNLYAIALCEGSSKGIVPSKQEVISSMQSARKALIESIQHNLDTDHVRKYLWRIVPFNETCRRIISMFQEFGLEYSDEDVAAIKSMEINCTTLRSVYKELHADRETGC